MFSYLFSVPLRSKRKMRKLRDFNLHYSMEDFLETLLFISAQDMIFISTPFLMLFQVKHREPDYRSHTHTPASALNYKLNLLRDASEKRTKRASERSTAALNHRSASKRGIS